MSVRTVQMFQVVCDRCGKVAQEDKLSEYWAWADAGQATDDATSNHGWLTVGDQAFCPDEFEYDEETDEYQLKAV